MLPSSWQVLTSRLEAIERKYGLQDKSKVRDDAIFDMYKSHIKSLRSQVRRQDRRARLHLVQQQLRLSISCTKKLTVQLGWGGLPGSLQKGNCSTE